VLRLILCSPRLRDRVESSQDSTFGTPLPNRRGVLSHNSIGRMDVFW